MKPKPKLIRETSELIEWERKTAKCTRAKELNRSQTIQNCLGLKNIAMCNLKRSPPEFENGSE